MITLQHSTTHVSETRARVQSEREISDLSERCSSYGSGVAVANLYSGELVMVETVRVEGGVGCRSGCYIGYIKYYFNFDNQCTNLTVTLDN